MRKILVALFFIFSSFCFAQVKKSGEIKLFLEPLSPQGWQAFFLADAVVKRSNYLHLTVKPVISQKDGKWYSARGDAGINEAARMMAIEKKYPKAINKYLMARSLALWADGWKDAAVYAGINPADLFSFLEKNKKELLDLAFKSCQAMNITSSAIYLEDKKYEGEMSLLPFLSSVNKILPPSEKIQLFEKELASFKAPYLKIFLPKEREKYNTDKISSIFKRYIPSIKEEKIEDYSLYKEFSFIRYLPAYVLEDEEIVRESLSDAIASGIFEKHGKYFVFYDKNSRLEIKEAQKTPGTLEIFVMSQCPFGVMAENAVIESIRKGTVDKNIKLQIRYIATAKNDGQGKITFDSLHGEEEWKEDARQIYIAKKYPSKFFDYLIERNKNYSQAQWTEAARKVGLNPAEIENNFDQAKKLLEQDVKRAQELKVDTSPTFLVDSKILVVGLSELKKIPGYENISSGQTAAAGACGN